MDLPRMTDLDRAIVDRGGLAAFARLAWPYVSPESPLVWSWHMQAICDACEAVSAGRERKLVINVPPGTGKSILTGVMWIAWDWIATPTRKWLAASYDPSLAMRDASKVRDLVSHPWYITTFGPRLKPGPIAVSEFYTTSGGMLFSTSPKGRATGRHVHIVKIDDPIKPIDAMGGAMLSTATISQVRDWRSGTLATRRADPERFAEVLIMQRVHEEDLAGDLVKEGHAHLCLPMRWDPAHPYAWHLDPRARPGASPLLFPERYPESVVSELERVLGPYHAAAQLQQIPSLPGGNIFSKDDISYWVDPPTLGGIAAEDGMWWQSWDLAFKGLDTSDFVAGGTFLARPNGEIWLVDIVLERMGLTDTIDAIQAMRKRWPKAWTILVEDKANGPAVEDAMSGRVSGLTMVEPMGSKVARAHAATPYFRSRLVRFPPAERCPIVLEVERQIVKFPKTAHDDAVDMISQALVWHRAQGVGSIQSASEALAGLVGRARGQGAPGRAKAR